MNLRTLRHTLIPAAALALFMACGGASSGPKPKPSGSSGLAYVNPKGASWNLVQNPGASTDTHLVLDLLGPSGQKGRGIGFNLKSDGSIAFSRLGAAGYVNDLGVFQLHSTFANYPVEPVLLNGGLKQNGTLLTVGVFQKDRYQPAQDLGQAVCQIAIDFDPAVTAALKPGTPITLTITKAKAIPSDIGAMPADPADPNADWSSVYYAYATSLVPAQISVGTLTTK